MRDELIENLSNLEIKTIREETLGENDILVIETSCDLSDDAYSRLKKGIEEITNHKKILILEAVKISGIVKVESEK